MPIVLRKTAMARQSIDCAPGILAKLELSDPDDMEKGNDFSAFMKSSVPQRLRRRALRRLWLTNPVLANVDNLVDYGEDFTDAATVIDNLKSAYVVGKGMLEHTQEMERQRKLAEQEAQAAEEETVDEDSSAEEPAQDLPYEDLPDEDLAIEESDEQELLAQNDVPEFEPDLMPAPRRMRFEFASQNEAENQ